MLRVPFTANEPNDSIIKGPYISNISLKENILISRTYSQKERTHLKKRSRGRSKMLWLTQIQKALHTLLYEVFRGAENRNQRRELVVFKMKMRNYGSGRGIFVRFVRVNWRQTDKFPSWQNTLYLRNDPNIISYNFTMYILFLRKPTNKTSF